jgi:hypothetical protein
MRGGQQAWFANDINLITARRLQSQIQRVGYIFGPHVGAQLPHNDVAVIIKDRAELSGWTRAQMIA